MRRSWLVLLLACDEPKSDEGGGVSDTTDTTDTTAPTDVTDSTATGLTVAEMCNELEIAFEACATGSTTTTATGESCEAVYAECSQADLQILVGMAHCIAADCQDFACFDDFADLSSACLGISTGGYDTGY
jgi:hypothetical protein